MRLAALFLLGAIATPGALHAQVARPAAPNEGRVQGGPRLSIERNLEYSRQNGAALTLDLYRPDPVSTPTPLVVWIHGVTGGESSKAVTPAAALVTAGFAVASIDYRNGPGVPLTTSVEDATAAVRWLRANASRFNIDPTKVGVFGHDLGATVAAVVGTSTDPAQVGGPPGPDRRVQAVVALAGPVNRAERGNPLALVTSDDAPMLLMHGTADTVVPTLDSQALVAALKVAGVDATLELQIGVSHDLNRLLTPLAMQQITGFFDQVLRGARRPTGTSSYLSTPLTEYVDPVALDLGGTLYKTYATPVRGAGTIASYRIYLPPDYETSRDRRYPVIYFLHGSLVDSKRPIVAGYVARVDAAIRSGVMPPTIVVMPQGLNQNRWMDSRDGTKPMESVIVKNLIPHIDATYRTMATRQGRAIEGHSMGGFGALHIGFKNPELFAAVTGNAPGGATLEINPPSPGRIDAFQIVYGGDRDHYVAMAPTSLAAKNAARVREQAIRIIVGTKDDLFPGGQWVHDELTKLGIAHEWLPVPESPHNHDQLLQYQTFDTMAFYGKVFGRPDTRSRR